MALNPTLAEMFADPQMVAIKQQPPAEQRLFFQKQAQLLADYVPGPDVSAYDLEVALTGRNITVRRYTPARLAESGAIIFFHGGGWMLHDIDVYHLFCQYLADRSQSTVFSVDYRLAPENKFPAGLNDAFEVTEWLFAHAGELGVDANQFILCGDSAGGNFAAVVCNQRCKRGDSPVLAQALLYPALDLKNEDYASRRHYTEAACVLDKQWLQSMYQHYFHNRDQEAADPFASPLYESDLSAVPATLMLVAECDPLKDEEKAYRDRLEHAGVAVTYKYFPTMPHGFLTLIGVAPLALAGIQAIGHFCREQFANYREHNYG